MEYKTKMKFHENYTARKYWKKRIIENMKRMNYSMTNETEVPNGINQQTVNREVHHIGNIYYN